MKLLFPLTLYSVLSFAGNSGWNGGHPYIHGILDTARQLDDEMQVCGVYRDPAVSSKLSKSEFLNAVDTVLVEIKNHKNLRDRFGQKRAARNNPSQNRIQFTKAGWEQVLYNERSKRAIVLHEYLGVIEAEENEYTLSDLILAKLDDCRLREDSPLKERPKIDEQKLEGIHVATISNRKSQQFIQIMRKGDVLEVYLSEHGQYDLIKSVSVDITSLNLDIRGERKASFYQQMNQHSRSAYRWCFDLEDIAIGETPAFFLFLFTPLSLPLCSTLPAAPWLIGVLGLPFDGVAQALRPLIGTKDVLNRKFKKALLGKSVTLSNKYFVKLVNLISTELNSSLNEKSEAIVQQAFLRFKENGDYYLGACRAYTAQFQHYKKTCSKIKGLKSYDKAVLARFGKDSKPFCYNNFDEAIAKILESEICLRSAGIE